MRIRSHVEGAVTAKFWCKKKDTMFRRKMRGAIEWTDDLATFILRHSRCFRTLFVPHLAVDTWSASLPQLNRRVLTIPKEALHSDP